MGNFIIFNQSICFFLYPKLRFAKKKRSFIIIAFILSLIGVGIDFSYQEHHNTYEIKTIPLHTGIESLPPTPGAWNEHINLAHLQAHLWAQDHILHPTLLDPTTLG